MATTTNYGWAKPALTDAPNGPVQIGALADAIDNSLKIAVGPVPPLFVGWQNAATAQSVATSTWTALVIDQEDMDNPAEHSTTTNPTRYFAPLAGWYSWSACAGFTMSSGRVGITYGVNGTATTPRAAFVPAPGSSGFVTAFLARHVPMNAGDYLEAFVWQSSGASAPVANVSMDVAFFRPS